MKKSVINWSVRLLISAIALLAVFLNVNLSDIVDHLTRMSWGWQVPALCMTVLGTLIKTSRLKYLIASDTHYVSFRHSFAGYAIGVFGNIFLPLRGGDVLRCAALSRLSTHSSMPHQVGIFMIEKTLEMFSFVAIAIGGMIWFHQGSWQGLIAGIVGFGIVAMLIILMIYGERLMGFYIHLKLPFVKHVQKIIHMMAEVTRAFRNVSSYKQIIFLVLVTMVLRIIETAMFWFIAQSLGMDIGFAQMAVIFAFFAFGVAVPAAPGFIGTFEAAIVYGAMMFGVSQVTALSFALTTHAWLLLSWFLMGMIAFMIIPASQLLKPKETRPS